ncbi:MAG: tetratricopeptide repeat protein, partial [Nitrospiraceae bacterium]
DALHYLGLLAYQIGKLDQSLSLIARAIEQDPKKSPYHFNCGVVLQKQGRHVEAAAAYERALSLTPTYVEAQANLGNVLMEQGKLMEAESAYRKAIADRPDYVEAHNNLGAALKEQGHHEEAMASYRKAISLKPTHVEAHCNLGISLMEQGKLDEAVASYERALELKPGYVRAHYNLAFALIWRKRFDQAMTHFRRSAELKQDHGGPVRETSVNKSRIKHDVEQVQYLLDRGMIDRNCTAYLDALQQINRQARHDLGAGNRIVIGKDQLAEIAPSYNRILHVADCPEVSECALNPALDISAIEARYNSSKPEIMYIDELLTDPALQSLRKFCLESTIWKRDYENGYLGAFLGDGFASPLLLQIAEELRLRFPGIFKEHLLTQAWAFKYDSELTGLNIHADSAAVNVNFWITPDDANLGKAGGGLVVWDREAPKEWNFKEYNNTRNEPRVREFLKASHAQAVTVPYRQNRAVVFNSDLFHETDALSFRNDYESRRVNVTLLYGRRNF